MVMKNKTKKYSSNIGQKTGTSKSEKNVMTMHVQVPRVQASQNLNSGRRRAKGRNSFPSLAFVGSDRPSSSPPPIEPLLYGEFDGSSSGDRNAMKLFKRKITLKEWNLL